MYFVANSAADSLTDKYPFRTTPSDSTRIIALNRYYGLKDLFGPVTLQLGTTKLPIDLVTFTDSSPYRHVKIFTPDSVIDVELWKKARTHLKTLLLIDASESRMIRPVRDEFLEWNHREFHAKALDISAQLNADILFDDDVWQWNLKEGIWVRRRSFSETAHLKEILHHG